MACSSSTSKASRLLKPSTPSLFWGEIEQQARFLKMGANLLIHSADISLFQKHLKQELDAIRRTVDQTPPDLPANSSITI
jgi:hypothetical protein